MKRTTTLMSLLIMASTSLSQSLAAESVLHPVDLRCEYLKNPLGIDRTDPRLSWKLQAAPAAGRGLKQTAFQIQVAMTEQALAGGKADLWDSGKVNSDQSNQVAYSGQASGIAPDVLVEGPNLGPGRQGFGVERTCAVEHGVASAQRLGREVDWLERWRPNAAR